MEDEIKSSRVVPEDELFPQQWYLYNNGYPGDINIFDAWDITMGNENVKVGIIELNHTYNHEDMNGRIEYTGGAAAGIHPTSTTGEIAANHNNDYIAGVTSGCNIRSYGFSSNGGVDDMCNAFNWAYQNNCRVLNNSWSMGNMTILYTASLNMENLIKQGVLFVCSSGNYYNSDRVFPSAYPLPGIIAVGASTKSYARASYSTYHDRLDIVAPGGDGPYNDTKMILLASTDSYCYNTGTSFAAPLVSGTAALCLSVNPYLYPEDIEQILKMTADSNIGGAGWDAETGDGLLDAGNAVSYIQDHSIEHFSVTE